MRRMMRIGVCLLCLTGMGYWSGAAAWGEGSFSREDFQALAAQAPEIAAWLDSGLDLDEQGSALRIGQNMSPGLSGARIGPYVLLAKPKGAAGPFTLELTLETDPTFKDAKGKVVDIAKAVSVEEAFVSLSARPFKDK